MFRNFSAGWIFTYKWFKIVSFDYFHISKASILYWRISSMCIDRSESLEYESKRKFLWLKGSTILIKRDSNSDNQIQFDTRQRFALKRFCSVVVMTSKVCLFIQNKVFSYSINICLINFLNTHFPIVKITKY